MDSENFDDISAERLAQTGLKLWRGGQREQALEYYNQAITLAPKDAITLLNRASLRLELGNLEDAMQDFERAKRGNPKLPEYLFAGLDLWQAMSPEARKTWVEKRRNTSRKS